jgi:SAM-dependent methyltransferase
MSRSDRDTRQTEADPKLPSNDEELVRQVRERYGEIAASVGSGCCGSSGCCDQPAPRSDVALQIGYAEADLGAAPEEANLGLGCGAPVGRLELHPGETVLDLGSGPGFDALLAARQVGDEGRVIGVDMTPEMLERARANARRAGASQVEFREGRLETLPVDDGSVDAVTSNCVINLVPDKGQVFREIARVLRPGGRLVISDILLDAELPEALRRDVLAYVGCVSGAMLRETYFDQVRAAGMTGIEVLSDVDFLAAVGDALPEEVVELMRRTGVRPEDVAGKVRSVTFRAVKP